MVLRACYAMSGTDVGYAATRPAAEIGSPGVPVGTRDSEDCVSGARYLAGGALCHGPDTDGRGSNKDQQKTVKEWHKK
eukprot:1349379-Rhodomonas_salina.2